jgi:hypothetical protein
VLLGFILLIAGQAKCANVKPTFLKSWQSVCAMAAYKELESDADFAFNWLLLF